MGFHVALFLILSLSSRSFAAIAIATTNTNASNVTASTVAGGGPNFYYSNISGQSDLGTPPNWPQGTGLAGSCAVTGGNLINPHCVDSTTVFNFAAASTVATSGNSQMTVFYLAAGSTQPVPSTTTLISGLGTPIFSFPYSANNLAGPGSITFGSICTKLAAAGLAINGTCQASDPTTPFIAQLWIVADANGDGIFETGEDILPFTFTVQSQIPINSSISGQLGLYGFETFPGDGEVFLIPEAYAPGIGVSGAFAINFYYATGGDVYTSFNSPPGFSNINTDQSPIPTTTAFQQIGLNTDGTLSNSYITSLSNGTSYYFRASVVDTAGNIGYMTPSGDDDPPGVAAPFHMHAAKPDQIVGLLSKNGQCFIATAAYGTPMAKQVQILREFRDKILMQTTNGKKFVYWYYKNGNALANKIRDRDDIRAVVRTFLYPLIGYSWLALKIGAFNAALLISTLLMLPLLLIQLKRSRKTLEELT